MVVPLDPVVTVVPVVVFVGVAVSPLSWLAVSSGLVPESLVERACADAHNNNPDIINNALGLTVPPTSIVPPTNAWRAPRPLRSKVEVEHIAATR